MNHVSIKQSGPQLSNQEIETFERDIGAALPKLYKSFLLRHNGGVPSPDTIEVSGLAGSPTDVQVFFGIDCDQQSSDLSSNVGLIRELYPNQNILPIACDSGGGLFCLMPLSENAEEIFYCGLGNSFYRDSAKAVGGVDFVASNIESFLSKIR